ncbi:MAG: hypothetical protein HY551_05575 [Elusimicrobia bacterium]|nr:hypothetical protein [Elusimicrobiota bacterium]
MTTAWVLWLGACGLGGTAASAAAPPAAAVSSTAAVSAADLYRAHGLRDPFLKSGGGSSGAVVQEPGDFSIHKLILKGILKDPGGDFALLIEPSSGASYILKKGRLYDAKRKPVPGVTGLVKSKQKMVHLMTPEKDVQTLVLGEEDRDREGL